MERRNGPLGLCDNDYDDLQRYSPNPVVNQIQIQAMWMMWLRYDECRFLSSNLVAASVQ